MEDCNKTFKKKFNNEGKQQLEKLYNFFFCKEEKENNVSHEDYDLLCQKTD